MRLALISASGSMNARLIALRRDLAASFIFQLAHVVAHEAVSAANSTANIDRTTMANNAAALSATAAGATIRSIGNNIFNNTTAFAFAGGGVIASDGQNRTGGNTNGQDANASVTLK